MKCVCESKDIKEPTPDFCWVHSNDGDIWVNLCCICIDPSSAFLYTSSGLNEETSPICEPNKYYEQAMKLILIKDSRITWSIALKRTCRWTSRPWKLSLAWSDSERRSIGRGELKRFLAHDFSTYTYMKIIQILPWSCHNPTVGSQLKYSNKCEGISAKLTGHLVPDKCWYL